MSDPTRSRSTTTSNAATSFAPVQSMGTSGSPSLRVLPNRGGRRPLTAVASVALVATCSALFALLYVHSSHLISVIAVTRQVTQGEIIEESDLREVDIGLSPGVSVVPLSDANQVIGRAAAVTLLPGTLVAPADLLGSPDLASGQSVVGVDLKPGMLPASGVVPGERVLVVLTGAADSPVSTGDATFQSGRGATSGQQIGITAATVVGVNNSPDDAGAGDIVVSVQVPLAAAPLVADWSAAGQAALVQVGARRDS